MVKGQYTKGLYTNISRRVKVTGIDPGAFDEAEQQLQDAGYPAKDPGASVFDSDQCDRTSKFSNLNMGVRPWTGYSITLCGKQSDVGYALTYDVQGGGFDS